MEILLVASIIISCAVLVLLRPDLINVLSEGDRKKMNPKKTGRAAFWGLMTTALVLVVLYVIGIRHELVPIFVVIPGVLITITLIQCSISNK